MASLGSLVIQMAVDTAKFQGDLGRAASIAESRMRNIRDTATKSLAAFAVVGTAIGGALVASTKQAIDAADRMGELAEMAGTTAETMSRLGYAAKLSATDVDTVAKAMAKLAKGGAKDSQAALLGLADQISELEDPTARVALASEALGERLGPQLVPLLSRGSAGIREMANEADALGVTISGSTAAAAGAFNDQVDRLIAVTTGFKNTLAEALLPTLTTLADELLRTAQNSDALDKFSRAAATGLKGLLTAGELVRAVFIGLGNALGAVAASIVQIAQGNFRQAWSIIEAGFDDVVTAGQESATRILDIWDDAGRQIVGKAEPFVTETERIALAAKKAEKESLTFAQSVDRLLTRLDIDVRNDVARGITEIANETRSMTTVVEGSREPLSQMSVFAEQAARNMQSQFAEFFYSFDGGLKGMLGSFVDTIRRMVAELVAQQLLMSFFNWAGGGVTSGWRGTFTAMGKSLEPRAMGGPVLAGGAYLVGERGPEVLMMGSSSGRVIPNGAGGLTIAPVYHIDARGATQDLVRALPAILEESNRRAVALAKSEIRGDIKRFGRVR